MGKSLWVLLGALCWAPQAEPVRSPAARFAIATFHCLGLYWSPAEGSADRPVTVRYRKDGAADWKDALPMRYNPIPNTDEDLADYRGSIVELAPGTSYEVQLALSGTAVTTTIKASTWSEEFPSGEVVKGENGVQ